MKTDIAIIGGGASGIAAAIFAARSGKKVAVLEKNQRVGKKILSTGNGRCNFTNANASVAHYNSDFVEYALGRFSQKDAVRFFDELGLLAKEEAEGRIYPLVGQATAILDVLRLEMDRLGVRTICDFDVATIKKDKENFIIKSKTGDEISAQKVIVATGGMAAPKTGSDGSGYRLLTALGHTRTTLVPSLVQIKTKRGIQGVRANGKITLEDGKSAIGEIQFASTGISGIPAFGLAKYVKEGEIISVDLLPEYNYDEVLALLKKRPVQTMETYLIGIINKTLAQVLLKECGITPLSKSSKDLTDKEIKKIAGKIKKWDFVAGSPMPWENAQVTAGGITLSEVNEKTMESKLVPGLYITGELLDIDGACGGFNLQWAWASGYVAGSEAAGV